MSVILLVLGIVVTASGVVATGFGVPISDSAIGQTLFIAGSTGIVGGLILIGLAAAVNQLAVIAEALKTRVPARIAAATEAKQPIQPAEPRSAPEIRPPPELRRRVDAPEPRSFEPRTTESRPPEPRPPEPRQSEPRAPEPAATDVSSSAIERLRSTMARPLVADAEEVPLSPNGSGQPPPEPSSIQTGAEPIARPAADPDALAKEPKLDFLFRAKPKRAQPAESFDAMWPKRGEQPRSDEIARQPSPEPPVQAEERRAPPPAPPPRPAAAEGRSVAILKSGVVDGMAYTLYADGSIEAQLPHGTVRFGSIAELRAHIENNS
jgi:hypothetical protein